MKKRQIIIIGASLLLLTASVSAAFFLSQQKEEPEIVQPKVSTRLVKTKPVQYENVKTKVEAYGRVKTSQTLDVISEVSGKLLSGSVRLKEGSSFKKGQLIYRIDDEEATLNLKSQKSNFLRDLASILPDMKLDFDSSYDTWQSFFNDISMDGDLPELPKVQSEKEKTFLATKGIFSTYYTIRSAEVRLEKYKYYAPFDGSISEVAFQTGSYLNPGSRIAKIMRSGSHELQVSVESSDIEWIAEGSPADIYSTESNSSWTGVVTRIADYVNQNTQSIDVFISIYPGASRLFDGQFLQAEIPASTIKDGMRIPREAIYNGSEVFVVVDSALKVENVNIYRLTDTEAIVGGIPENSDLVIEPLINAYNNMQVIPLDQSDINLESKSPSTDGLAASGNVSGVN